MTVRGSVDAVSAAEVRGWAFAPGGGPVRVQAVLNHEILGEASANLHRPDLAAAGLGDGSSGYVIKMFRPIEALYWPFVAVKVNGGDAELPRMPALGFSEFFAELHRAHPAAGRSRSVLGGLWTDRTDAAALLRGRLETGQLAPGASASVGRLIQAGAAVLEMRSALPEAFAATAEQVGTLVEDVALLPLLRAVLEDHPLVLRAELLRAGTTALAQPSAGNPGPSPAECLELVVPLAAEVALEVVRDSHLLPEFTPQGASRWASGAAAEGLALPHGMLDRHVLAPGTAAAVGPGTLHRVQLGGTGRAVRLLCLPARATPAAPAAEGRRLVARASGVRVWV